MPGLTVFVTREAMDDLGGFRKRQADDAYVKLYEPPLLDDIARALTARKAADGRLRLSAKDLSALA